MNVRPLAAGDLEEVLRLEQEVYAGRDPWSRTAFEHELHAPASLWLVTLDDTGVQAYTGGWILAGNEFHLLNLAVAPARRRTGIARELLVQLLARAARQGCRSATLEVRRGNEPARALYESLGFRTEGVLKGYYTAGEDAIIYLLEVLPPPS